MSNELNLGTVRTLMKRLVRRPFSETTREGPWVEESGSISP